MILRGLHYLRVLQTPGKQPCTDAHKGRHTACTMTYMGKTQSLLINHCQLFTKNAETDTQEQLLGKYFLPDGS